MATDFADIEFGLQATWAFGGFGFDEDHTEMENDREREHPATEAWVRLTNIHNDPVVSTLGPLGEDRHSGNFFIQLFYPKGGGSGPAREKADEIRTVFNASVTGQAGAATLYLGSCALSGGRVQDNWFTITAKCPWTAITYRS